MAVKHPCLHGCKVQAYSRGMVDLRTHLRKAARKRWANASEKEKKDTASHASRAYWDSMTPEQRSAEMKRRAAKRKLRKATK